MTAIEEEELRKKIVCKSCNGNGHFEGTGCSDCYGSGWFVKPDEALRLLSQQHEREIAEAKSQAIDDFTEYAKRYGFERLDLVVEYQDGTNSGVIPFREHWNRAYDKFLVAAKSYRELQQQPKGEVQIVLPPEEQTNGGEL